MGSFITDLKNSFNKGNIYIQFIYINVGVFIVTSLLGILWMLFNRNGAFVLQYLELPAWTLQFVKQPWSLLTYMFMHAGILHLLFNMLWLYWFGQMFLSLFSAKHFRGLYLLGGICGGLLYMIAYNVFLISVILCIILICWEHQLPYLLLLWPLRYVHRNIE